MTYGDSRLSDVRVLAGPDDVQPCQEDVKDDAASLSCGCKDEDGDGVSTCDGDCDDTDPVRTDDCSGAQQPCYVTGTCPETVDNPGGGGGPWSPVLVDLAGDGFTLTDAAGGVKCGRLHELLVRVSPLGPHDVEFDFASVDIRVGSNKIRSEIGDCAVTELVRPVEVLPSTHRDICSRYIATP